MSLKPGKPDDNSPAAPEADEPDFDSTLDVLERARQGDGEAARVLIFRCTPRLVTSAAVRT